ncbi:MAG: AMP-binding protein [Bacteroidales bacterium]|nr:AMP-binding protein [Bacteroidales bacterium]
MPEIPQRLLGESLLISARKFPGKTAIINRGIEYTYEQFLSDALHLASNMAGKGLEKGDRVVIYLHNSWQCALAIYATSLAGGVFMVVNIQTKASKLNYILNDSFARFIITEDMMLAEIDKALEGNDSVKHIIFTDNKCKSREMKVPGERLELILKPGKQDHELPQIIPNDLAALIYTSGSTGFPKGVMMTHQSMVFTTWSLIEYLRLEERDRIMLMLPLAFDYGLYQLLMSVTLGATLIIEYSFTFPASIYKAIDAYQPTVFPGVPTIYAMMIASNKESGISFPGIEKVTNTAAALPAEFIPGLQRIFPNALIFSMYGLTECKRVCYLEPELIDLKPRSVGKAIPGTEVFLLDTDGNPVSSGLPGILHVRGPHVMAGYWNRPDLSAEMLKPGKLPGEKILCSNDWFTKDEEGFLYFQGRNDDIIKTRGEKVSPVEIENVIYQLDGVRETAVLGIPHHLWGEAVIAFITIHEGSGITDKMVLHQCSRNLESFMIPLKVIILDQMPKSANGKIDKKELKPMAMNLFNE